MLDSNIWKGEHLLLLHSLIHEKQHSPSHYPVVSDPCSVTSVVVPTVCWAPTEIYREPVPCSVVARFNPSPLACNDISYLRMTSNESPLDMSEDPVFATVRAGMQTNVISLHFLLCHMKG